MLRWKDCWDNHGLCGDGSEPALSEVEGTRSCMTVAVPHRVRSGLSVRLDDHRCSISEHFRDALHHFGRIVTGTDHGVSAQFSRVL